MSLLVIAPTAPSVSDTGVTALAAPGRMATEVVVVGTGAGGAAAGRALAKAGRKVLFLEEGGAFPRSELQRKSFRWSAAHLWAQGGVQLAGGNVRLPIPTGCVVGGSTVLNSAICFRPPDRRLEEWVELTGASHLGPEPLRPFVDEIWRDIGVSATHAGIGRRNNVVLHEGLTRLAARTPGLRHAWMDRSAPGCIGCGTCHLGCPSGGKASVDRSLLPDAVNHGARIMTRARVERILVEGGRATGVVATVLDPETRAPRGELTVRADVVVVAGNALYSPLLLERSGLGGPERGRHLAIHPGLPVIADFDEPVRMWSGVPQGYWADCPEDERALVEVANFGPDQAFTLFARAGNLADAARMHHYAMAGTMIRDDATGTVTDAGGTPSIRYEVTARDLDAWRAGTRLLVRAYFAAGARRVAPAIGDCAFYDDEASALRAVDALRSPADVAQPYGSHPHGTCRMGPAEGPHRGVVDEDGQVHGAPGVYVMDGSIFPSTLGVNPQVTIMSVATMLARRLVS